MSKFFDELPFSGKLRISIEQRDKAALETLFKSKEMGSLSNEEHYYLLLHAINCYYDRQKDKDSFKFIRYLLESKKLDIYAVVKIKTNYSSLLAHVCMLAELNDDLALLALFAEFDRSGNIEGRYPAGHPDIRAPIDRIIGEGFKTAAKKLVRDKRHIQVPETKQKEKLDSKEACRVTPSPSSNPPTTSISRCIVSFFPVFVAWFTIGRL